jgi:DNA-binding protein HU-beta
MEEIMMNKKELVRAIANNARITLKDAEIALDSVIGAITDGLNAGEKIQISGFGTFELKSKGDREGINPKTGEKIQISASKTPVFKFGKAYKDSFNK